jgi:hypothetical protein
MTGKQVLLVEVVYRLYNDDGPLIFKQPVGLVLTSEGMHYEELKFFEPV